VGIVGVRADDLGTGGGRGGARRDVRLRGCWQRRRWQRFRRTRIHGARGGLVSHVGRLVGRLQQQRKTDRRRNDDSYEDRPPRSGQDDRP
jgi:hypothetical protein